MKNYMCVSFLPASRGENVEGDFEEKIDKACMF